jgi:hypothetical protein
MTESEIASLELTTMMNDTDAETFFSKGGPLSWFSLKKTYTSAFLRGSLTEKQVPLVRSVYQQYTMLKKISARFSATGEANKIATMLYQLLHQKPKVGTTEERGRSQKLSRVIRAFRDGAVIHIGHFNQAESLVGSFPIPERIAVWEQIHSARRNYLSKLHETDPARAT